MEAEETHNARRKNLEEMARTTSIANEVSTGSERFEV
jgi:hypothetical protein